jgi:hypothetical protein
MEKIIYRTSFIESDSSIAFEFSSFVEATQFIKTAFDNATRPGSLSVVVNRMKIDVKEVGLNE